VASIEFKQPKICCISDVHLGVHQNNSNWHKILLDWVRWLDKNLKQKGIKDIMICGDLFHYRDEIAVNSLQVAKQFFDILTDYNIIMITGNHDCYYKDTSCVNSLSLFSGWENITVIDTLTTEEIYDKRVTFVPWGEEIRKIPRSDLIFGHFELTNFKMNNFKICDHGDSPDSLLKKSKMVITGHFHLKAERNFNTGKILYLGNPFQMDFGDAESEKGYYILDFNDITNPVFYINDISPVHKKILLSDLIKFSGVTTKLKELIKGNIIKLVIDKNIQADDLDIIMVCLNNLKPFSINVDYEINFNKFSVEGELEYEYSGVDYETAITDFVNMLDINNKHDVIQYTVDLYKSCKE
jgi:DNA repair exonuclease SbcCD nuclease subunit